MENIMNKLQAFLVETTDLADAYSLVGRDDDSYDVGAVREECEETLTAVKAGKMTPVEASQWLDHARTFLARIR